MQTMKPIIIIIIIIIINASTTTIIALGCKGLKAKHKFKI